MINYFQECCIFELYQHTKSYLTEKISQTTLSDYDDNKNEKEKTSLQLSRMLIWTHHLLSLEKRKNICQWAEELGLWGIWIFMKLIYLFIADRLYAINIFSLFY